MKIITLLFFVLWTATTSASKPDSTFQRHQLSFSMMNGMSHEFFDQGQALTTSNVRYNSNALFYNEGLDPTLYYPVGNIQPNYALKLQIAYSLGLSHIARLEVGFSYLLSGYSFKNAITDTFAIVSGVDRFDSRYYIGALQIPVQVKLSKQINKGSFTCKIGPVFSINIHEFAKVYNRIENSSAQPDVNTNHLYSLREINNQASMGARLKMAYEMKLTKLAFLEIGPEISFNNLVYFSQSTENQYKQVKSRPYDYYIGLDVAVNLNLKKK